MQPYLVRLRFLVSEDKILVPKSHVTLQRKYFMTLYGFSEI